MIATGLGDRRVIVTRPESPHGPLSREIENAGGIPVHLPVIAIEPVEFRPPSAAAIRLSDYLAFTSASGVRCFAASLSADSLASMRRHSGLAAVGPATAAALESLGCRSIRVASDHVAESLADELGDVNGRTVMWVRGDRARPVFSETLEARGARLTEVVVYRTVPRAPTGAEAAIRDADAVTFTSPSGVESWVRSLGMPVVPVACIGVVTAREAFRHGIPVATVANPHTIPALVRSLCAFFASRKVVEA